MSIRTIGPVSPQAILPMTVTLFPSGIICVTNIPSTNCSNCLFRIERRSRWWKFNVANIYIFEIHSREVEKLSIWRKFDLWSLIPGLNVNLGKKNAPLVASTHREQSAGLFFYTLWRSFWKREGGRTNPLPLCHRRWRNGGCRRGLMSSRREDYSKLLYLHSARS